MRTIKKYGNRRLYDTGTRAYINLEQLAAIIRDGEDVEVVDVKTGEDLTRGVLVQVILEVQGAVDMFPTSLLQRVIRSTVDTPYHRMALKQMSRALVILDAQMTQMEKQFGWGQAGGGPPPRKPASSAESAGDVATQHERVDPELDALRDRLEALEERLKR